MRWSRRTREVSEGHCGLKPSCRYVLSYKAPWAHGGACCGFSGRAANKTAWEKKMIFFCSVLFKRPGGVCVCLQSPPWSRQGMKSSLHICL